MEKEYDAFTVINGAPTDAGMHDIDDDKELIQKINDHYRTVEPRE
ncbi:hypothetical protein [Peribacillus simplex]|nr:hypothetical protein [Peribacillus simplex]